MATSETRPAAPGGVDEVRAVREWASGWSTRDIDRVVSLFTSDGVYENVTLGVVNRGADAIRAFGDLFTSVAPDFTVELADCISNGDAAPAEWTMSGTTVVTSRGCPPQATSSPSAASLSSNSRATSSAAVPTTGTWPRS
jgi:uncharacterized protein (TIGR02246 family)